MVEARLMGFSLTLQLLFVMKNRYFYLLINCKIRIYFDRIGSLYRNFDWADLIIWLNRYKEINGKQP